MCLLYVEQQCGCSPQARFAVVFSVIVGRAEGRTLVRVVGVAVADAVVTVVVFPLAGAGVLGAGAGFSLGARSYIRH